MRARGPKASSRPPPPLAVPTVTYERRLDRLIGRYTAEWDGPDGRIRYRTLNRIQDWEGRWPSLYSIVRLPYVFATWRQAKKSLILPKPVPFIVLDAIRRLDRLVTPGTRVLEIGGGNSTLWFLGKGADVMTFEHDAAWLSAIKVAADRNPHLHAMHAAGQEAADRIAELPDGSFDVALVDSTGHIPAALCIEVVLRKVKAGGWLVLDNSDMPANWLAVEKMGDRPAKSYVGYAPMALKVGQTTFWRA